MLTCFLANQRGLAFYRKLGFETDDISPVPRKLRYGKIFTPDYVILSKTIRSVLGSQPKVEKEEDLEPSLTSLASPAPSTPKTC